MPQSIMPFSVVKLANSIKRFKHIFALLVAFTKGLSTEAKLCRFVFLMFLLFLLKLDSKGTNTFASALKSSLHLAIRLTKETSIEEGGNIQRSF